MDVAIFSLPADSTSTLVDPFVEPLSRRRPRSNRSVHDPPRNATPVNSGVLCVIVPGGNEAANFLRLFSLDSIVVFSASPRSTQ